MARQVNFYMTTGDEQEFLNFVRGTGNVEVLPHTSLTNSFSPVRDLPKAASNDSDRRLWLFNRSVSTNLVIDYDPENGRYSIDGGRSSTVEFARSFLLDNTMQAGWIWAEFTTVDTEAIDLGQKEKAFKQWFEKLANWIRREYLLTGWLVYAGRGALKFQDNGGILP